MDSPENGKHLFLFSVGHFGIRKEFYLNPSTHSVLLQLKVGATAL